MLETESHLKCHADGFYPPPVFFSWTRDGKEIQPPYQTEGEQSPDGYYVAVGNLTFYPSREDQNVTFGCRVSHNRSVHELDFHLNITCEWHKGTSQSKATMTRHILLSCRTERAPSVSQIAVLIWVSHVVKPKDYLLFLHRSPFCSTFRPAIPLPKHSSDSLLWRGEFLPGGSVCVLAPKRHSPTRTPCHWAEPGWDLQNQTLLHSEHRAEGPRWEGGVCCEPTRGRASSQWLCVPGDTGSARWNWTYDGTFCIQADAVQFTSNKIFLKKTVSRVVPTSCWATFFCNCCSQWPCCRLQCVALCPLRWASSVDQISQSLGSSDVHFSGAGLSALLWLFLEEEGWWVRKLACIWPLQCSKDKSIKKYILSLSTHARAYWKSGEVSYSPLNISWAPVYFSCSGECCSAAKLQNCSVDSSLGALIF